MYTSKKFAFSIQPFIGSTEPGHCRRKKDAPREKHSRRTWSSREEAVLLASLQELVANGWKADNGFRGGYLQRLEDAMVKEFKNTDIQISPHINSKLQIWKKNYNSLHSILKRSGIGFNVDGKHTIECEDAQWEQICKCDSNAMNMRHKSWPMFEQWKEIFDKDRATGDNAEDCMDAVNDMKEQPNLEERNKEYGHQDFEMNSIDEEMSFGDVGENSVCHEDKPTPSVKSDQKGKGKGKKKRGFKTAEGMAELFCEISRGTNERLEMVAQRIGHEYDIDEAKKDAFNQLKNIPGLSLEEKFDVCDIFADNHDRLLVFKGLPENARAQYVHRLLKKKH